MTIRSFIRVEIGWPNFFYMLIGILCLVVIVALFCRLLFGI